ncbi:unnamed protein product [Macrosiphum euphorbiae]|uniref:THAP-type domain-containing protein n=1 Tax=Macrosiphum euphorbiae TaxID=13131 RepID=A0AAV0WES4_9HEMI|nr:unnamed protein product [Macrosiphum euphorbiae]
MLINQLFSVFQKILHNVIFGCNSEHWMTSGKETLIKSHELCSKHFTKWITKNPKPNRLARCNSAHMSNSQYSTLESYIKCQLKPFLQVLILQILYLLDISTKSFIAKKL